MVPWRLEPVAGLGHAPVEASYTSWTVPGLHWNIGGVFVIVFFSWLAGLLVFIYLRIKQPPFFRKETLTRATPTLVPDD